ncbi:tetratricopeptide repeat protein [bacterium]|nr:tetratricopeptide repeat protein [bacterium]
MKNYFPAGARFLCRLLPIIVLAGCASSRYATGVRYLQQGNEGAAVRAFADCIRNGESAAKAVRELGVIYYNRGRFDAARQILLKAFTADSTDGRTLLFLGSAYEGLEQYDKAIGVYRRYRDISRLASARTEIEAKLTDLLRKKLITESRRSLAQESMLDAASVSDSAVAVLYFGNLGDKRKLDPLQKGLTDMLITDLSHVRGLEVIERARLQAMMDEMKLSMTGMTDAGTAPRMGRLLGVSRVVQGGFVDLSGQSLRIDAGVFAVKEGSYAVSRSIAGRIDDLFALEKKLVLGLIEEMGITLSLEERDAISRLPTENVLAFIAYCQGMDYEDAGNYEMAGRYYDNALRLDPGFTKVAQSLSRTRIMEKGGVGLPSLPETAPVPPGGRSPRPGDPRRAHLQHVGDVLNQRFLPGVDERRTTKEETTTDFGDVNRLLIEIQVTLPDW